MSIDTGHRACQRTDVIIYSMRFSDPIPIGLLRAAFVAGIKEHGKLELEKMAKKRAEPPTALRRISLSRRFIHRSRKHFATHTASANTPTLLVGGGRTNAPLQSISSVVTPGMRDIMGVGQPSMCVVVASNLCAIPAILHATPSPRTGPGTVQEKPSTVLVLTLSDLASGLTH